MRRLPYFLFLCSLGILAAGCGSGNSTTKVHGRVTLDGDPVSEGIVHFESVGGKSASAKGGTIKDGAYTAEVPPGTFTIKIHAPKVVGKRKAYDAPDSPYIEDRKELIPAKYNLDSTRKEEIKGDSMELNFELKTK